MAVDINATGSSFSAGKPRLLFEGRYQDYDISPDGQRFLMVQNVEPEQPASPINVVLNWAAGLAKK